MRMNQEKKTCPVFWPMVPCDAKKCEKMCLDFYGPPVSAYCDKPGSSNANCACLSQTVRSFDRCISLCIFLPRNK
ncbi:hypothetical protein F2Q68_00042342 [Brassica cretica]|uniref:Uncharacterized protein n=1 Tax=Brassica cretica TaxID=69181 RepID=A0A8S9MFE0_BRACR|nr:hypothetical protein F2Q68_00042342 [Brassica cretica]